MTVLRDPLLHFAFIGLALFFAFTLLRGDSGDTDSVVTVSEAQQRQLAAAFSRVWRRPPSEAELKSLIDDWIKEELANREAIAMGLGQDDLIIRRRLRQKYEAFMAQIAAATDASDDELLAWYEEHAENYREAPRYSFVQLFFSRDRRADAAADAAAALSALEPGNPLPASTLGDSIALPRGMDNRRAPDIAGRFGEDFAQKLAPLPEGQWTGPISSAYGEHLVFIESKTPSLLPPLASVRADVLRDWRDAQIKNAREANYAALLERYAVIIDSAGQKEP